MLRQFALVFVVLASVSGNALAHSSDGFFSGLWEELQKNIAPQLEDRLREELEALDLDQLDFGTIESQVRDLLEGLPNPFAQEKTPSTPPLWGFDAEGVTFGI